MTNHVTTQAQLLSLFGTVAQASLRKETPTLHPVYQAWINASPFAVLATSGPAGLDASPRGDPAPLVRIADERTLLLPERRGNNRIDGLQNILLDPRVALIFFVPGVRETVRVNGRASISIEPALLQSFAVDGAAPKCVLEIAIDTVFFQCGRALIRSNLWEADRHVAGEHVPSAGSILSALTSQAIDGAAYDQELPSRQRTTLY